MGGENTEYGADQIQILDQVCISEVHPAEVFIIWFMRL